MRFCKKTETENRHEITDSFDKLNFEKIKQHVLCVILNIFIHKNRLYFLQMLKLVYKFSAKKTSMSTFSGFNCARAAVLTSPALLKRRSDGELEA